LEKKQTKVRDLHFENDPANGLGPAKKSVAEASRRRRLFVGVIVNPDLAVPREKGKGK